MARLQDDLFETDINSGFTVDIKNLEQQIRILESKDTKLQDSREKVKLALRKEMSNLN